MCISKNTLFTCILWGMIWIVSPVYATQADTQEKSEPVQYTAESLSWCGQDKITGWDFYCDTVENLKKALKQQEQKQDTPKEKPKPNPYPYSDAINKQQQALEEAKAKAILEPTLENLAVYMYLQQKVMNQASSFAKTWQRVLVENPALDYTLDRPQATLAKQTWYDSRKQDQQDILKHISERFGIVWFYMSTCPYCHQYAPIIKSFTQKYDIYTIAVSIDGGSIDHFPDARLDTGQAEQFGVAGKPVPATVLYDGQTKTIHIIGYGILTHQDLINRIFHIMAPEKANDW